MNWNVGGLLGRAALLCLSLVGVAQAQTPAKMSDYWAGNAKWEPVRKWTVAAPAGASGNVSSKIKVVNGTWYLFQREFTTKVDSRCVDGAGRDISALGVRVYTSTNQGQSWTAAPELSLAPVAGTDFACMVADGDATFDAATNRWRGLFQCLGTDSKWRGCYFERAGADPRGAFDYRSAARARAVIQPGWLWARICNAAGETCYGRNVTDEGTFDIFRRDASGYFWVGFHGYSSPNGFRGIAKTTDFQTWVAGDPAYGLPADAVMSKRDANGWREGWASGGNIGAGAGSILEEDGYTYQLTEFADMNLSCTAGQHWDLGLFRTNNLTSTQWEQFPLGNPIVYSSTATESGTIHPCNVQYGQIFRDESAATIYMKFGRETSTDYNNSGTFLYRLVKSTNLLKNGDLWMADTSNWQRLPAGGTTPNYTVYRWPNLSSDGNQFLATNCAASGSACVPGSSFFQDVSAAGYAGRSVIYGGKFATAAGNGGSPTLALFQLDANGAVLTSNSLPLPVSGTTYASFKSPSIRILDGTRTLRYQFYHAVPGVTYFAGGMFLDLQ